MTKSAASLGGAIIFARRSHLTHLCLATCAFGGVSPKLVTGSPGSHGGTPAAVAGSSLNRVFDVDSRFHLLS